MKPSVKPTTSSRYDGICCGCDVHIDYNACHLLSGGREALVCDTCDVRLDTDLVFGEILCSCVRHGHGYTAFEQELRRSELRQPTTLAEALEVWPVVLARLGGKQ